MNTLENWPITKLIPYAKNPRVNDHAVDQLAAMIKAFGFRVPILAKSDGNMIDGHLRLKAAKKLKLDTVLVMIADDMTDEQIKAFRISVNQAATLADWDDKQLALDLAELRIDGFDMALLGFGNDDPGGEEKYTTKVTAPIYEITGPKPDIKSLISRKKTDSLLKKISASTLPGPEKEFLIFAAQRHTVFDYGKIAEYYAHSNQEMQYLMEESALVIIDFKQAIELGYVTLTKKVQAQYEAEYGTK